jgi:hypothetical protein
MAAELAYLGFALDQFSTVRTSLASYSGHGALRPLGKVVLLRIGAAADSRISNRSRVDNRPLAPGSGSVAPLQTDALQAVLGLLGPGPGAVTPLARLTGEKVKPSQSALPWLVEKRPVRAASLSNRRSWNVLSHSPRCSNCA